jgi:hypothetical protein
MQRRVDGTLFQAEAKAAVEWGIIDTLYGWVSCLE